MASLVTDKTKRGAHRRILFKHRDGKRKPIRLGAIPLDQARGILAHVKHLEAAQFDGSAPPPQTSAWLSGISDSLRAKLEAHQLCSPRAVVEKPRGVTLVELVEAYKARPKWRDKKPATHTNYNLHFDKILGYLGADTPVEAVTETMAEDLHGYLGEPKPAGAGLSRASANRFCDTASMLFRFAVRSRLVTLNPFDEVHRGVVAAANKTFVEPDVARRVIDAMKDSQWRLLVALARYGGLRVPSEPRLLRWADIDRERNRIRVTSPKTEHHHGHESREIPLFPELVPYIDERWGEAEPGEELVLPMMRALDNSAFRNQLDRTVRKIGVDRWPRIFHSLRASRQTELEERFPTHVVNRWMGNSADVAQRHYLMTLESHYATAAQIPAQHTPATPGMTVNV